MAIQAVKYFHGTTELGNIRWIRNESFAALFPGVKGIRVDSFSKFAGYADNVLLPVERVIEYKKNPTLHKCDARCRHAKGKSCECSCGGANHGAN